MPTFSRVVSFFAGWSSIALLATTCHAIPDGFVDESVFRGGSINTAVFTETKDGTPIVYAGAKDGDIFLLQNIHDPDSSKVSRKTALNLRSKVCTNRERGIQSVIAHSNFRDNGFVYVYRTLFKEGCPEDTVEGPRNRLSRYTARDDLTLDEDSELIMFETPPGESGNHNGGAMAHGNDGKIWITLGDNNFNGGFRHPQNKQTLFGALIRLNDDGTVPSDNPWSGGNSVRCNESGTVPELSRPDAVCAEIYATGLRNPFRLTMDRDTKDEVKFYILDVGGRRWEEMSEGGTQHMGVNYGWEHREGPCKRDSPDDCSPDPLFQDPVYWYHHVEFGGAVTGGTFVPRDSGWPTEYSGTYFFADFVFMRIYHLTGDEEGGCRECDPPLPNFKNSTFQETEQRVVEMFFGPYGSDIGSKQAMYYVYWGGGGGIRRVRYTGTPNRSPEAVASADKQSGPAPFAVHFDGSESSDPDGDELVYNWKFGNGETSAEKSPSHTFRTRGTYDVTLTVTDPSGLSDQSIIEVAVGEAPSVRMINPSVDQKFAVGDIIELIAEGRRSDGSPLNDDDFEWEVQQHHDDHWHPFLTPTRGNRFTFSEAPGPEDYFAATNSFLKVILKAYDNGVATEIIVDVMPKVAALQIETAPPGQIVLLGGARVVAPASVVSWENFELSLDVVDDDEIEFHSWSNLEPRRHYITVPPASEDIPTFTARFQTDGRVHLTRTVRKSCTDCGMCEGHCSNDEECRGDLKCFQKDRGDPGDIFVVPGCYGADLSKTNWCTFLETSNEQSPLKPPVRSCSEADQCGLCEGNCHSDAECEGDLVCYKKRAGFPGDVSVVPGCFGEDVSRTDWCIRPADRVYLKSVRSCSEADKCGLCEGNCHSDAECAGGLVCYKKGAGIRGNVHEVPGCFGEDLSRTDWCVNNA